MRGAIFQTVLIKNGSKYSTASAAADTLVYDMVCRKIPYLHMPEHPDSSYHDSLRAIFQSSSEPEPVRFQARAEWGDLLKDNERKIARAKKRYIQRVYDICVKAGLKDR